MTAEVEQIARGLTKASRRAIGLIERAWTEEGSPGPSRRDAYSLGWGKDAKHCLVDKKCVAVGMICDQWAFRLTPLGKAVRQHFLEASSEHK